MLVHTWPQGAHLCQVKGTDIIHLFIDHLFIHPFIHS